MNSSTVIGNSPEVLMNFNRLFLKLNWFICNQLSVPPHHCCTHDPRVATKTSKTCFISLIKQGILFLQFFVG